MCCFLAVPFLVSAQISAHFTPSASMASQTFNHTGGLQTFTVPAGITELTIYSAGATGGNTFAGGVKSNSGGSGGVIGGRFAVTPGETLTMLVGEAGDPGNTIGALLKGGGGGGGSFVFKGTVSLANLLLVSGGGGGGGNGKTGGSSDLLVQQPGDLSSGGAAGGGAGGAGITLDGTNMGANAIGGKMIIAPGNGAGGTGGSGVSGGYGGGGEGESSAASDGGGGGGGYSGGEGGPTLGGDASTGGFNFLDNVRGSQLFFNASGNPVSGNNERNGQVVIAYAAPQAPIPTMNQWGLIIFGLLVLNLGLVFVNKQQAV